MNEEDLGALWTTLEPTAARGRRIETRVAAWLDARDTPLAREWLALVGSAPFATLGLATVGAVAIVATTPLAWLAYALM